MVSSMRHSVFFLFVVPENQVWTEISMGDVRGKGIWLVVWETCK